MPSSIRTIDATSTRFDPDPQDEYSTSDDIKHSSPLRTSGAYTPPSPADSGKNMRHASPRESPLMRRHASPRDSPTAMDREERRITREIGRGAPGDQAIFSEGKTTEQKELAKKKSQYYGDVFANREPINSARERISRESHILADVRTNVIIQDEYTFITDLSYALSTRYQRSESSILVSVTHSCCLLFGGSFDPAYTLAINALPSQLQPVTNKRNAALLAKAMEEGLGVAPDRGLIKFCAIAEDNLANGGKTIAQEIEELERETAETNINLQRSLSKTSKANSSKTNLNQKGNRRQSMKSLRSLRTKGQLPTHEESSTASPSLSDRDTPPIPALSTELGKMDKKAQKVQKMGRRKSFIATIFGRGG